MAGTYCGKDCTECVKKETNGCTGCASGAYGRECEIAVCCREKGHESCGSCTYALSCRKRIDRDLMPEKLIDKRRREEELYKTRMAKARLMGKWLWPIFWAVIAQTVVGLIDNEFVTDPFPAVEYIAAAINAMLSVCVAWCYLQLGPVDERYRFVGFVQLGLIVYNLASQFLPESNVLFLLLSIPVVILGIMSEYRRCMAHSDSLAGICDDLSEKWQKQWRLYVISFGGFTATLVLLLIPLVNFLASLAMLVFACMILFVAIRDYVYLYQTADLFRACPGEDR